MAKPTKRPRFPVRTPWGQPTDEQRLRALDEMLAHPEGAVRRAALEAIDRVMKAPKAPSVAEQQASIVRVLLTVGAMNRAGFNVSAAGLLADDFSGIGKHMRALGLSRVGQETLESAAQAVTRGRGKPAVGAMKGERATALRKVLNELGVPIQSDAALKKLIERHAKVDAEDWRLGGIAAGIRPPK